MYLIANSVDISSSWFLLTIQVDFVPRFAVDYFVVYFVEQDFVENYFVDNFEEQNSKEQNMAEKHLVYKSLVEGNFVKKHYFVQCLMAWNLVWKMVFGNFVALE